MKGKHNVIIQNNRLHYEFTIRRNITIIRGDSATGKTTLINMIRQHNNLGNSSGVELSCDVPCRVLEGPEWKLLLNHISGSILFIDEENKFIHTEEFASAARESGNYFVLITRDNLYNLPYSVEEIYGLHSSGKYQNTRKTFQQTYRLYSFLQDAPAKPEKIITEDSHSGFEFFQAICREKHLECISAEGKSNFRKLLEKPFTGEICVIADGAAIGPEMNLLYEMSVQKKNIRLYFPESFEWLILKSGLIDGKDVLSILQHPEESIDSEQYFSWERFFTALLIEQTKDTYMRYSKQKLNEVYLHEKNKTAILQAADGLCFEKD